MRESCDDDSYVYSLWWWFHKTPHVLKLHRVIQIHTPTHISACIADEIGVCATGGSNINFLFVIFYSSYARHEHWRGLWEVWVGLPHTFFSTFL